MARTINITVGREPRAYARTVQDVVGVTDSRSPVLTPGPTPSGMKIFVSSKTTPASTEWRTLDARIAGRMGVNTPLFAGRHSYSGSSFPSSYGASTAKQSGDYGCKFALLNVKTNWTDLASGALDSRILGWPATMPSDFTTFIIFDHEPENDGRLADAPTWRAGQARAANLIASMNHPRFHMAVCHMAFTWKSSSGRNPNDWNPNREGTMTSAALARTIFAPDGYCDMNNTSGSSYDTMGSVFDAPFAAGAAWGFQRFAISENTLNNDIGASGSVCANWWTGHAMPYIRSKNLVYYALYNSTGPAAGTNAYIDTVEEETAWGSFLLEYR